jgi:probable F420-dependent oxidoreductase
MQVGVIFPTAEIGNDPVAIRDFAQTAEELGFAYIAAYDHVVGAEHDGRDPPLDGPYTQNDPFHEPVALFGYLAALTNRIRLATGIMILPQRQTVLVAKQMAELAVLSGDRIILGVGTGWNPVEYEALGVNFKDRGALLDEQVVLLRQLWTEPLVDFQGRFHRVDRAGILPLPNGRIPIWMGGFGRRPIERASRHADGFFFGSNVENANALATHLQERLLAEGRETRNFSLDLTVNIHDAPEQWHRAAAQWQGWGKRNFSLRTMGPAGLHTPGPRFTEAGQHIQALETFMSEMRQHISE